MSLVGRYFFTLLIINVPVGTVVGVSDNSDVTLNKCLHESIAPGLTEWSGDVTERDDVTISWSVEKVRIGY